MNSKKTPTGNFGTKSGGKGISTGRRSAGTLKTGRLSSTRGNSTSKK